MNTITNASISGKTIELSLARTINSNESVTVSYNDPTGGNDANAVQDTSGNDASSLGSTSVTNTRPSAGNDPQTIITTVSEETTQATEQIPEMKEESKKLAPTPAQPYPASLASDEQDSRKKSIPLFNTENLNDSFGAGRSNDGIGTALNIFGATLLALINPAVAIRNFLENLKGSGSKEICQAADNWPGSAICNEIQFQSETMQQVSGQKLNLQNQDIAITIAAPATLGTGISINELSIEGVLQPWPLDHWKREFQGQELNSIWN